MLPKNQHYAVKYHETETEATFSFF